VSSENVISHSRELDGKPDRSHLVNSNLAAFKLLSLRNQDAQNTILHRGLNLILIDANREAEGAGELADAAFRDPVLAGRSLLLLLLLGLRNLLGGFRAWGSWLVGIVFDSCFVGVGLACVSDGTRDGGTFDVAGGAGAALIVAFCAAADVEGLRVDELNLDVLLGDSWKLAVELVSGFNFLDVELGLEGLQRAGVVATTSAVVVEFIEEAEEGCEGGFGAEGGER